MRRALPLDRTRLIAEARLAIARVASATPASPPLLGFLLFSMLLPDGLFDRLSLLFVMSAA